MGMEGGVEVGVMFYLHLFLVYFSSLILIFLYLMAIFVYSYVQTGSSRVRVDLTRKLCRG